jgi:hypothetical protein
MGQVEFIHFFHWGELSHLLPSGNVIQFTNLKMAIEIVDLSINNGDFPVGYVNVYQRVSGMIQKVGGHEKHPTSSHHWFYIHAKHSYVNVKTFTKVGRKRGELH